MYSSNILFKFFILEEIPTKIMLIRLCWDIYCRYSKATRSECDIHFSQMYCKPINYPCYMCMFHWATNLKVIWPKPYSKLVYCLVNFMLCTHNSFTCLHSLYTWLSCSCSFCHQPSLSLIRSEGIELTKRLMASAQNKKFLTAIVFVLCFKWTNEMNNRPNIIVNHAAMRYVGTDLENITCRLPPTMGTEHFFTTLPSLVYSFCLNAFV